ncbi:carboxypeptidase regulatory-like domain-containing protein [Methanosarcina sp.]|uniref:carboxypeptidase regulatory-like domain-containing protein n=1 Tax=Methanosarcina sp. TaxID=2213 RepID=UPI0029894551|nr:carboxypeptidase regulatory-like domain-containing protein [Methanosarcina sp.]MDW5551975.1 carboxypeptidase regulatory-like domain-containing protein [Methanosarcina sp.]MDW5555737.1 carboxypeptidase regulatory-like domain-containing protein [Methanosarcina sp.]MDW5561315.1 carboxypeptidase regulatory-like domain-containing protein [Methanosarcina sp.]
MLREKFKHDEAGTLGLPIRIVVLTVVGLIGFCTILTALSNAPAPPKPMYATANMSVLSLPSTEGSSNTETNLSLPVKVFDSENRGIKDANVIAWSPDRKRAYSGVTDLKGNVILKISNPELPSGKAEGYIKIKVMREGYRDFTSDYFLKVIQS